eukprot:g9.t1
MNKRKRKTKSACRENPNKKEADSLHKEDFDLWGSEDALSSIVMSPVKNDVNLSHQRHRFAGAGGGRQSVLARTPERKRRKENSDLPPTPSTASPNRMIMARSPFLDSVKMMHVFQSPNGKYVSEIVTPLKHGHSPMRSPLRQMEFSSPFTDFARDLSPLRHNVSNGCGIESTFNAMDQSPLNVLSTLGSAVKDRRIILRSELASEEIADVRGVEDIVRLRLPIESDTSAGLDEISTSLNEKGKKKKSTKKKKKKASAKRKKPAKKTKANSQKGKKSTKGTKRPRGGAASGGALSLTNESASAAANAKKSYWKRLELKAHQKGSTGKALGGLARSSSPTRGNVVTPLRGRNFSYTSPRPELKFDAGRISLTTPSPKLMRSPSSYTIKLGISHSPGQLAQTVRNVNSMIRTPKGGRSHLRPSSSAVEPKLPTESESTKAGNDDGEKLLIPVTTRKPCNCKKSKCLKLYCECFAARIYCFKCNCLSCENNQDHEDSRAKAIASVLDRNPKAFDAKINNSQNGSSKQHSKGCHCKKSGCKKKYCECYQAGIACADKCKCVNCENTPADRGERGGVVMKLMKPHRRNVGNRRSRGGSSSSARKKPTTAMSTPKASSKEGPSLSLNAISAFNHGGIDFIETMRNRRNSNHTTEEIRQVLLSDSPLPGSLPILDRGKDGLSGSRVLSSFWDSSREPTFSTKVDLPFGELGKSSIFSPAKSEGAEDDEAIPFFGASNVAVKKSVVVRVVSFLSMSDLASFSLVSPSISRAVSVTIRERQIRLEWDGVPRERFGKIRPSILSSSAAVAAVRAEVAGKGSSSILFQKMAGALDRPQIASFLGPLKAQLKRVHASDSSPPSTPSNKRPLVADDSTPVIPAVGK